MISPEHLQRAFEASWSADTAFHPTDYSTENPARGQCVPTSLVAQDYLGGDIQKLVTHFHGKRETHYRNILHDGSIIDYTRSQYPTEQALEPATVEFGRYHSVREKHLSDAATRQRYELLRKRVSEILGAEADGFLDFI